MGLSSVQDVVSCLMSNEMPGTTDMVTSRLDGSEGRMDTVEHDGKSLIEESVSATLSREAMTVIHRPPS